MRLFEQLLGLSESAVFRPVGDRRECGVERFALQELIGHERHDCQGRSIEDLVSGAGHEVSGIIYSRQGVFPAAHRIRFKGSRPWMGTYTAI